MGEDLRDMRVDDLCEPDLLCSQRHKDRVSCSTKLSSSTYGRGYYSSAMRLRPYLAKRSLIASTKRACVVRSCWTASNLNCFAASGTTCAAINCRPCLPLPRTVVLGAAVSCTAAGVREPLFSGVNVNGVRLLIDVSSTFTRLDVCTFTRLHVYAFGCLQIQDFRQPSEERIHLGSCTALGIVFLRGTAVIHCMGERDQVMHRERSHLHASLSQGNGRLLAQLAVRRDSIEHDPRRFACQGSKIQCGANGVEVERCRPARNQNQIRDTCGG